MVTKETTQCIARTTFVFVLVALLINSGPSLKAQQVPANPKQKEAVLRLKASIMVDTLNQRARELGLVVATDDEQEEFFRKRLSAQLQEDFVKLGTTNVETVAVQDGSLDYKSLSATTADLKNRATRIKYNVPILMTPAKGEKPRYQDTPDQLQSMLPELNRLIDSFFASPIFRENSANDAALRAKAVRDLDSIIVLSDTISKLAKRMSKAVASSK
jgi:hypothetical protein